ncbi:unnamed protein product [Peronospora belbahrii]|uniref:B box-type domain-containing protein n=1 Tax=Peronospora belbahrii TaxID=622444 RepID=A0AAU9KKU4_9STRA|nr:unnamed protein product [Peronospora belbahrii]
MTSGDVPLVSPPHQVVEEFSVSDLCSMSSKFLLSTSQAAPHSTTDTTPNGSPASLLVTSFIHQNAQQVLQCQESVEIPQITSYDRSIKNEASSYIQSDTGGKETPILIDSDDSTAQIEVYSGNWDTTNETIETGQKSTQKNRRTMEQKNTDKMWFDVLPIVLQNIKMYDREQIRQLMLPRCVQCKRSNIEQKASTRCKQKGCIVLDCPMCLACWNSYHGSVGARKHCRQHSAACPLCQLDLIAYWCAECDLKFCRKCFEHIHSVFATKHHRKIATEDAPGTCLATSHWSHGFRDAIVNMIASRKQTTKDNIDGSSIGAKRKRKIEAIVIDDDDEEEENTVTQSVQPNLTPTGGTTDRVINSCGFAASQQNGSSVGAKTGFTRSSEAYFQPLQDFSVNTYCLASLSQTSMNEPISRPQKPTATISIPRASVLQQTSSGYSTARASGVQQTSSVFSTSPAPNGANTVNIGTSVGGMQWDASNFQYGASLQRGSSGNTTYVTSVTGNGMMQLAHSSTPTVVDTTSVSCSTPSAISMDLANTFNVNDFLPVGGAVFAENALIDSLVDRYHEVNQNVIAMELQSEQYSKQIAIATCQGPFNARPLVTLLSKLEPVLNAARKRRDQLLIAIIIQSNDIMSSVRLLRLAELGDVPQVPIISHRKCLQISNQINQHRKNLVGLYQQLNDTLKHSSAISSSWENRLIQTTNAGIQMNETNINKLKKARKVEFVRIVQFSFSIREALKHAFQRVVEIQRQHLQQQQQRQFQPSR